MWIEGDMQPGFPDYTTKEVLDSPFPSPSILNSPRLLRQELSTIRDDLLENHTIRSGLNLYLSQLMNNDLGDNLSKRTLSPVPSTVSLILA